MNLSDLVGTDVDGKYRVERMLGRGGMGAVYLATHLGTDRPVALKIIIPQYAADASFLERFRREARAAGRFRHPNIVDVTDFGFATLGESSFAYLVMEYLDGCSLEDILREQPVVPVDWTVEVFTQLALGIGELHRKGIIHRDLKPGNIWLEPNLRGGFTVKILDFGLAKLNDAPAPAPDTAAAPVATASEAPTIVAGAGPAGGKAAPAVPASEAPTIAGRTIEVTAGFGAPQPPPPDADLRETPPSAPAMPESPPDLTVSGSVLGTPLYMAPEQCLGKPASPASDVYSLGVIAYQMLAGSPPFDGGQTELMAQHIGSEPRNLRERNRDVPEAVSDVVMSALAKDPGGRPASAEFFAAALRSKAESPWELVRRGMVMLLEHFPVFVRTTTILLIPLLVIAGTEVALFLADYRVEGGQSVLQIVFSSLAPLNWTAILLGTIFARGVISLLIAQILLAPLKRVRPELVFSLLRRMLGPTFIATVIVGITMVLPASLGLSLIQTGSAAARAMGAAAPWDGVMSLHSGGAIVLGAILLGVAFHFACELMQLANAVLAEELPIRDAIRRSRELRRRAPADTAAVGLFVLILPMVPALAVPLLGVNSAGPVLTVAVAVCVVLYRIVTITTNAVLVAVLYFKARLTAGEPIEDVLRCQYVTEPPPKTLWQQRLDVSLQTLRSGSRLPGDSGARSGSGSSSGSRERPSRP